MARVDRAADHRVDELAVRTDRLEKRLELGMDEVVLEKPYRLGDLLVEDRIVADVLQTERDIDEDHRERMALRLKRRLELGRHHLRVGHELLDALEERERLCGVFCRLR